MLDRHGTVAHGRPYKSPNIDSDKGMSLKRRIDLSNQERTDTGNLDDYFYNEFKNQGHENSSWNTESPVGVG